MLLAPIDLERDTTELEWVMTNARWYLLIHTTETPASIICPTSALKSPSRP